MRDHIFLTRQNISIETAGDEFDFHFLSEVGLEAERTSRVFPKENMVRWHLIGARKTKPQNLIWWLRVYRQPQIKRYRVIAMRGLNPTDTITSVENFLRGKDG